MPPHPYGPEQDTVVNEREKKESNRGIRLKRGISLQSNKKIIRILSHVLLICRMNAMTATGIRERIHGMPDCCVVAGMGVTGCSDPGRDVATTVGAVTGGRVLFVITAD
jgi:hypothetical protein